MSNELDVLDAVRSKSKKSGFLAKAMIILLLIGMAVMFSVGRNYSGGAVDNYVFKLGSDEISADAFSNQKADIQQRYPKMDSKTIAENAKQILLNNLVLKDYLKSYPFGVSSQEVLKNISQNQLFFKDGKFDPATYSDYLKRIGRTSDIYVSEEANSQGSSKFVDYLSSTAISNDIEAIPFFESFDSKLDVRFITLPRKDYLAQVTDEQLKKYYDDNHDKFMTNTKVNLTYIDLNLADIANKITDKIDVASLYQQYVSKLQARGTSYLLFKTQADADKAKVLLAANTSFDDAKLKLKNILDDQGSFLANDKKPADVDLAIAKLQKIGDYTDVIKTEDGYFIVRLDSINNTDKVKTLAEMKDELAKQEKNRLAKIKFDALKVKLGDSLFEKKSSLEAMSKEFDLPIKDTGLVDVNSRESILKIKEVSDVIKADNELKLNVLKDPIETKDSLFILKIKDKKLPEQISFADAKAEAKQQLVAKLTNEAMEKDIAATLAKLKDVKGKTTLDTIAQEKKLTVKTLKDLTKATQTSDLDMVAKYRILQSVPELGDKNAKSVEGISGDATIYVVDNVTLNKVDKKDPKFKQLELELANQTLQLEIANLFESWRESAQIIDRSNATN